MIDEHQRLLDQTVEAYARSLRLTENQYRAGIVPRSDVSQAQTQLKSTQAQAIDLKWQRAQMEHAIAVLVGVAPSELEIAVREHIPALPDVPLAVPSQLLERRPDIASAERQVMAANANIGVAEAAWYPDLTLSASGGYRNSSFSDLFSVPNRFWSLGPAALTLLDFGSRRAELERAEASYDQTVANYRQTVLDSFREWRTTVQRCACWNRRRWCSAGAGGRTGVPAPDRKPVPRRYRRLPQRGHRADHRVEQPAHQPDPAGDRLTASVLLIAALGGGWDAQQLEQDSLLSTGTGKP